MRPRDLVLLFLVSASPGFGLAETDRSQIQREVLIQSHGGRHLAGTLTLPTKGTGPFAVAVSLTGSGPHFRDGNRTPTHPYRPFREIAAALAEKGVAMLRLDDRGVGRSSGDANATTGDDVADDANVAIAWLRARPEIDPARVAVIGHSFGGEVAPLVAATDPRLAAVVLMGAPAVSFRETMRYQHRYRIANDKSIPIDGRAAALEAAMRQQELNVAASIEKWRPWSQDRDPLPTVRRVRCPVLILQGTTDRAVAPEEAVLLAETLRGAGNTRVTLKVFESVNHHFQIDPVGATDHYDDLPSQALAPQFLETISRWLAETLGPSPDSRRP
jgi:dipeptidyl aminopeptidase/acylaminoacyl peptidase